MGKYLDQQKKIYDEMTPMECIDEVIFSLQMFYCEDNNTRLPSELHKFAGSISIAYKQAKLLKSKLEKEDN